MINPIIRKLCRNNKSEIYVRGPEKFVEGICGWNKGDLLQVRRGYGSIDIINLTKSLPDHIKKGGERVQYGPIPVVIKPNKKDSKYRKTYSYKITNRTKKENSSVYTLSKAKNQYLLRMPKWVVIKKGWNVGDDIQIDFLGYCVQLINRTNLKLSTPKRIREENNKDSTSRVNKSIARIERASNAKRKLSVFEKEDKITPFSEKELVDIYKGLPKEGNIRVYSQLLEKIKWKEKRLKSRQDKWDKKEKEHHRDYERALSEANADIIQIKPKKYKEFLKYFGPGK